MPKNEKALIIAEAGVNHNGDIALARQLVDVAVYAGADFVKFQSFKAELQATQSACKAIYQSKNTDAGESQYQMLKRLELSVEMHENIFQYCKDKGIGFLSTAFDIESADLLKNLGLSLFKTSSGEITNIRLLKHIGSFGGSVIVSTGMANLGEIERAIEVLENSGTLRSSIKILHCNSAYPTPYEDINLLAMNTILDAFGIAVGYSDHSLGIEIPIAAVALGASVIEKHFTLSRELPGPDHQASLEPKELASMIRAIRNVEESLGSSIKRPSPSESQNINIVRKSIVAARDIKRGERFTEDNLAVKRPGSGIPASQWEDVLGRTASRYYEFDEFIEL